MKITEQEVKAIKWASFINPTTKKAEKQIANLVAKAMNLELPNTADEFAKFTGQFLKIPIHFAEIEHIKDNTFFYRIREGFDKYNPPTTIRDNDYTNMVIYIALGGLAGTGGICVTHYGDFKSVSERHMKRIMGLVNSFNGKGSNEKP